MYSFKNDLGSIKFLIHLFMVLFYNDSWLVILINSSPKEALDSYHWNPIKGNIKSYGKSSYRRYAI